MSQIFLVGAVSLYFHQLFPGAGVEASQVPVEYIFVSTGDKPHPFTVTYDIPGQTCPFQTVNNKTIHSLDDKHVT